MGCITPHKRFRMIRAEKRTKYNNYIWGLQKQYMKPGGGTGHFHFHFDSTCYFSHGFLQSRHSCINKHRAINKPRTRKRENFRSCVFYIIGLLVRHFHIIAALFHCCCCQLWVYYCLMCFLFPHWWLKDMVFKEESLYWVGGTWINLGGMFSEQMRREEHLFLHFVLPPHVTKHVLKKLVGCWKVENFHQDTSFVQCWCFLAMYTR